MSSRLGNKHDRELLTVLGVIFTFLAGLMIGVNSTRYWLENQINQRNAVYIAHQYDHCSPAAPLIQ